MKTVNYNVLLPKKAGESRHFGQLITSAISLVCAKIAQSHSGLTIIITRNRHEASRLIDEVKQFTDKSVFTLVDWETLPYDNFSPHQDIISERLACLYRLTNKSDGIFIVPISSLMQKVCPKSFLSQHVFLLENKQTIRKNILRDQLLLAGYRSVEQVIQHGEFASRGSILDLFPMGSQHPYRLDFLDDEIDSIRTFDVDTQRTIKQIPKIELLPAHEFPFNKQSIELFRSQWREKFDISRDEDHIYQQITKGQLPGGIEYWQPLFFETPLDSLFNYFPQESLLLLTEDLLHSGELFWQDIQQRYENRRYDRMRPLLSPNKLWLPIDQIFSSFKSWPQIKLSSKSVDSKKGNINFPFEVLPAIGLPSSQTHVALEPLRKFIDNFSGKIVFSVESEGRREALYDLLKRIKLKPELINKIDGINDEHRFYTVIGASEHGFIDTEKNLAFICESDLLGEKIVRAKKTNKQTVNVDTLIRHLAELKPGQLVVHLEHGIGRYEGLTTLDIANVKAEYLILSYANDDKLYVPVSSLHLISRYTGNSSDNTALHRLGSDVWTKTREKAAEKIRDVAAELLDIYASREIKKGVKFKHEKEQYQLFCQGFPFEATDDQKSAISAVIGDMVQGKIMDRLICGDVGFGKTEVAMRAAFLAVFNHKQVAILVPTTLLAQQHYDNFKDRFANWPVRVEVISRFKTAKEQQKILEETAEGKVDILIGTHKLLQNDIHWKDLGLLIIDEEHRFGVRQKEKIKALRADVAILTLTATPIPRTLNMAMGGMRDLSIIATPPARRLSVKTFVRQYDDLVIREAILREILRGGQVYYLSNDVKQIDKVKEKLIQLVPEATFETGHGQMGERELERVMLDFHHKRFNVLICSTIIETGIDIPNANTMIIERADKFGLAQLHQLRGRVGRSHHQAYAYLLTPPPKAMTKEAKQRLEAIASLEDLGSGFVLATHDLEIRGAGELLGEEQSGQIESIGFSLYMELLENAVKSLNEGKQPTLEDLLYRHQTEVELRLPSLLPDDYVSDINARLSLYKRIASAENESELEDIKVEIIDRFGLLPDPSRYLFISTVIRLQARQLGIKRIEAHDKGGFIEFSKQHKIDPVFLVGLLQKMPQLYRLDGQDKLKFTLDLSDRVKRINFIEELLLQFDQNSAH